MLHTIVIIHNITIVSHITGTKVIFGIYPLHHHAAVWGDDVEVDITTYTCMSCVCCLSVYTNYIAIFTIAISWVVFILLFTVCSGAPWGQPNVSWLLRCLDFPGSQSPGTLTCSHFKVSTLTFSTVYSHVCYI